MDKSEEEKFRIEVGSLSYEEAFSKLENVAASLESGQLPLEEALALYGQGKILAQHCQTILEQAELRIKMLSVEQPISDDDEE